MTTFVFKETPIKDLLLIETVIFTDDRGNFQETFRQDLFAQHGVNLDFVQSNQSRSKRHVLRGLHFQTEHPQGKLVRAICGEVYDVAVDLRKESPTFGKWYGVTLGRENKRQLYVPPGFAHGFLTLSDEAIVLYNCTDYYDAPGQDGIVWNDPTLAIDWPIGENHPILSEKDQNNKTFAEYTGTIL